MKIFTVNKIIYRYLPLIKKTTVNNFYSLLINLGNITENYKRLMEIFTVYEYN